LAAAPGVLVAAALLASTPGASAAGPTAVDCSTADLQAAIESAAPGATLAVKGTCWGSFTIGKDLTVRGQGTAVLDGQGSGTMLTVASSATVQLAGLTITGGNAGAPALPETVAASTTPAR
jgi:nitrous oxidase accessory protein NosD